VRSPLRLRQEQHAIRASGTEATAASSCFKSHPNIARTCSVATVTFIVQTSGIHAPVESQNAATSPCGVDDWFFRKRIQRARRSKAPRDDSRAHVAGAIAPSYCRRTCADDDFAQVPFFSQLPRNAPHGSRELFHSGNTRATFGSMKSISGAHHSHCARRAARCPTHRHAPSVSRR